MGSTSHTQIGSTSHTQIGSTSHIKINITSQIQGMGSISHLEKGCLFIIDIFVKFYKPILFILGVNKGQPHWCRSDSCRPETR